MSSSSSPMLGKKYAGCSSEERQKLRQQQIIAAGIRLFGSQGFHNSSVRAICSEAGLTSRYFYESFESTEALLIACYQQLMSGFRKELLQTLKESTDINDFINKGLYCFYREVSNPAFAQITMLEVLGISESVDAIHMNQTRSFGLLMIDTLATSRFPVSVPRARLEALGYSVCGAMAFSAIDWMKSGYKLSIDDVVANSRMILSGVVGQLGAL
ncbi:MULTISPECIES: TetR/AcrR family transcriptional regulator [unclassified Thalassolituus]|uniref:TetR/AcrR family transcriptional regulator n=1 Tax=Oceanospirillaceae TaxID=135620 RepID=UPI00118EBFA9|nr:MULTISPECIES: TetR/AcrR family transcriptional regulator [unclassified Thalassolituus]TVV42872.1 TetR/AcrR family transcriptional regulator [Thalassolituus sp. C2-1]